MSSLNAEPGSEAEKRSAYDQGHGLSSRSSVELHEPLDPRTMAPPTHQSAAMSRHEGSNTDKELEAGMGKEKEPIYVRLVDPIL